jgi:hypothetical protein
MGTNAEFSQNFPGKHACTLSKDVNSAVSGNRNKPWKYCWFSGQIEGKRWKSRKNVENPYKNRVLFLTVGGAWWRGWIFSGSKNIGVGGYKKAGGNTSPDMSSFILMRAWREWSGACVAKELKFEFLNFEFRTTIFVLIERKKNWEINEEATKKFLKFLKLGNSTRLALERQNPECYLFHQHI